MVAGADIITPLPLGEGPGVRDDDRRAYSNKWPGHPDRDALAICVAPLVMTRYFSKASPAKKL